MVAFSLTKATPIFFFRFDNLIPIPATHGSSIEITATNCSSQNMPINPNIRTGFPEWTIHVIIFPMLIGNSASLSEPYSKVLQFPVNIKAQITHFVTRLHGKNSSFLDISSISDAQGVDVNLTS